jgi:predicted 3-demethylubiquinone-9 3-methyltransferase (glyoxalase superfamily)
MANKTTICIWYEGGAEEAARFYANIFPDSVLLNAVTGPDPAAAQRAFMAMMPMKKIYIAKIEAALRG